MQQTQDDSTFGKAAGAGSEEPWKKRSPFSHLCNVFLSDSRTTLTASLALAFTVELSLLSDEDSTGSTCNDCNVSGREESGKATGRRCDDTDIHY